MFSSPILHPKPFWGGWFLASVVFLFWMCAFSDCVECLTSSFLSSDCRWRCVYFQTVFRAWPARCFPLIAGDDVCIFRLCWVLDQLVRFLWLQVPLVWRWRASCCRSAWWSSPSCPWRRPPTNWPSTRTSHRSTSTNSFPVRPQVVS